MPEVSLTTKLLEANPGGPKESNPEVAFATSDWKDASDLAESVGRALGQLGLFCYEDPNTAGSDTIGLIISKRALSEDEIQSLSDEANGVQG